ncbi:MAG: hypothetical protein QE493_06975 [Verrucomicrobiae bacterium]|nr:hypothetical protein [Verrucomicrobiae bacterium]
MDAALISKSSSGSRDSYSRRQISSPALPHQPSRPPRHDQYETSELTRIFHTDLLRKPGSQMDAALDSHFDLGSMYTYSPASKCSPALPHQLSRPPRHDQYETSGLSSKHDSLLLFFEKLIFFDAFKKF